MLELILRDPDGAAFLGNIFSRTDAPNVVPMVPLLCTGVVGVDVGGVSSTWPSLPLPVVPSLLTSPKLSSTMDEQRRLKCFLFAIARLATVSKWFACMGAVSS